MPCVSRFRTATAEFVRVRLPKLQAPLAHGFVGHDDPALGQKLFDIAKTEREAEIQPNSMADDFRRKAVASVIGGSCGCFHEAILTQCSATFQVDNITVSTSESIRRLGIWTFAGGRAGANGV